MSRELKRKMKTEAKSDYHLRFFLVHVVQAKLISHSEICTRLAGAALEANENSWNLNFHNGGPYNIETSPLICSAN